MMKKAELVFVPGPGAGHLAPTVVTAKTILHRDDRLSITVLIIKTPFDSTGGGKSTASLVASSTTSRLRFVELPSEEHDPNETTIKPLTEILESQKCHVKDAVSNIVTQSESTPESPRLAGFVLDMFCTSMIDVANEFCVPSYILFTSSAAALGLLFYIQDLHDKRKVDLAELKDSDAELAVPTLKAPLPARALPGFLLNKDWLPFWLLTARRCRETKGIIVNAFVELESHAVISLSDGKTPTVYPVGPILNLEDDKSHGEGSDGSSNYKDIMDWLDGQPDSSVVFLCFGSKGSFDADQIKEIARALEHSGHRFLWSLRISPPKGKEGRPGEHSNFQDALPEGFLDRTAESGKVIGWAPQVAILAHPAIGGFVSHCGWNSILESLWFGVPIATLPLYAEQQFNAFQLVIELGLAAEIKMDYRRDFSFETPDHVSAEEIERGIRCVMEHDSELKKKVKETCEGSRKALMDGGSSHTSLGRFIQHVINNMP
uniref:Glycosyltransferase n=1 Tax=Rhizophora mucronata TaxID=61149 RepID=A0A2P2MJD6_RHIMU